MHLVNDAERSNFFLTQLGNFFIQFQIEQNKKAEADSQAAKPEQSATAETLVEEPTSERRVYYKMSNVEN